MKLHASILVSCCLLVSGNSAAAETRWRMTVDVEHAEQHFANGDADIDTVTLLPSVDIDYWNISLSIPWQKVDGAYFVNNRFPNLAYFCSQVTGLSPAAKTLLVKRGAITTDQLLYCHNTGGVESATLRESTEGLGDLELFANYYLPPVSEVLGGSLGFGYKHDNGDFEEGIGTGSREAFVETRWLVHLDTVEFLGTLGYQVVLRDETDINLQDYAYGSLDGRWQLHPGFAVGATYWYLQANADVLKDLDYVDLYLELGRFAGISLRFTYTDYLDQNGYPDEAYRANISYAF